MELRKHLESDTWKRMINLSIHVSRFTDLWGMIITARLASFLCSLLDIFAAVTLFFYDNLQFQGSHFMRHDFMWRQLHTLAKRNDSQQFPTRRDW